MLKYIITCNKKNTQSSILKLIKRYKSTTSIIINNEEDVNNNNNNSIHLGIGKYFKIEVVDCDDDEEMEAPLISKHDIQTGTKVEDMLETLKPGESTSIILPSKFAINLAKIQTEPQQQQQKIEANSTEQNDGMYITGGETVSTNISPMNNNAIVSTSENENSKEVVNVNNNNDNNFVNKIKKEIKLKENSLENILNKKSNEDNNRKKQFAFVEATSKHLGTEAGEVFALKTDNNDNGEKKNNLSKNNMSNHEHTASHPFFQAAKNNDIITMKNMIEDKKNTTEINVNMTEAVYGGTALHYVASSINSMLTNNNGQHDIQQDVSEYNNTDTGIRNKMNDTLSSIAYLCEQGADVNAQSRNGSTPLHWAAGFGNLQAVKELLKYGADPTICSYTWGRQVFGKGSGQLASHWACESGHTEVVSLLMDASPETILSIDERKQTPKDLAVTELNDTTVQLIEERMEEKHVRLKITLINKKLFV